LVQINQSGKIPRATGVSPKVGIDTDTTGNLGIIRVNFATTIDNHSKVEFGFRCTDITENKRVIYQYVITSLNILVSQPIFETIMRQETGNALANLITYILHAASFSAKRANGPRFSRREASVSERSGRLEAQVMPLYYTFRD
jgi:hypothetical protein